MRSRPTSLAHEIAPGVIKPATVSTLGVLAYRRRGSRVGLPERVFHCKCLDLQAGIEDAPSRRIEPGYGHIASWHWSDVQRDRCPQWLDDHRSVSLRPEIDAARGLLKSP